MDLAHRFTVPTTVEETWDHFTDLGQVAECFPGAQVTSVEGDSFAGTVKVKLGPIALQYNGSGTFIEKDEAGHRFVIDAKGKDKRGNGTAGATVTLTMTPVAAGATEVEVLTDLAVTGKPAQFGRGVMQDVSDKLLGQFVSCLEQRLAADKVESAATGPASAAAAASLEEPEAATHLAAPSAPTGAAAGGAPAHHQLPPPAHHDEAIDLGATVLPVLAKAYWKQALGGVAVLGLIIWWLSRR